MSQQSQGIEKKQAVALELTFGVPTYQRFISSGEAVDAIMKAWKITEHISNQKTCESYGAKTQDTTKPNKSLVDSLYSKNTSTKINRH